MSLPYVAYQILPEGGLEIFRSNTIRVVFGRSECNWKIAEGNVEEVLCHDIRQGDGQGSGSHLKLDRYIELYGEDSGYRKRDHEIPGILFSIRQSDVARKEAIAHTL